MFVVDAQNAVAMPRLDAFCEEKHREHEKCHGRHKQSSELSTAFSADDIIVLVTCFT